MSPSLLHSCYYFEHKISAVRGITPSVEHSHTIHVSPAIEIASAAPPLLFRGRSLQCKSLSDSGKEHQRAFFEDSLRKTKKADPTTSRPFGESQPVHFQRQLRISHSREEAR